MLSKFVYHQFLTYNRKHFNGITWYYNDDDTDEISDLSTWECIYDDLLEYGFAAVNTHL